MEGIRRIGVDTGGTFTDSVLIDYDTNTVRVAKIPSRPGEPHRAILDGVEQLRESASRAAPPGGVGDIESVTHGTTIATNAVITGDLARVGLITTQGSRDILEIGTQQRPSLYNLRQRQKPPMITRDLRMEVAGRIAATGDEVEELDLAEAAAAADRLLDAGVEAIAVAGLFSFLNPDHEQAIQRVVQDRAPELYVGRSSGISAEPREYPRFATAAVNAALAPKVDPYIRRLEAALAAPPFATRLYVMQSNGGIGTAHRSVGENAHQLILSGPAAGVIGAAREASACGFDNCVTFDVGGTSADIGVVVGGIPRTGFEMQLPNGVPCRLTHIEVETIGAGGGSLAWVDAGQALHVGPQSAGAEPGPACYGNGGTQPAVTDAHLQVGRLSQRGLIGGDLPLDPALAEQALQTVGDQLDTDASGAALGVLAVIEENMAGGIRAAAARHGDDLRDFVLVAGGGAGPLHAASVMRSLGMPAAVIPPYPGLLSALGLLGAHIRHDRVIPLLETGGSMSQSAVDEAFIALAAQVRTALEDDGLPADNHRLVRSLDVRYLGQDHALPVATTHGEPLETVIARFHQQHERTFGHAAPEVATEIVSGRIAGIGLRPMPDLEPALASEPGGPYTTREVTFDRAEGPRAAGVFRRAELAAGQEVAGPAIVEQLDTTTVVPPGCRATVHASGSLIITADRS